MDNLSDSPSPVTSEVDPSRVSLANYHVALIRLIDIRRGERSDARIAREAGIHPVAFSRIVNAPDFGRSGPVLLTLIKILRALNATLADLESA